jgi:hypothetical protein
LLITTAFLGVGFLAREDLDIDVKLELVETLMPASSTLHLWKDRGRIKVEVVESLMPTNSTLFPSKLGSHLGGLLPLMMAEMRPLTHLGISWHCSLDP